MLRTRVRYTPPNLEMVETRTYKPTRGTCMYFGTQFLTDCWPLVLESAVSTPHEVDATDQLYLGNFEKIEDEVSDKVVGLSRDRIKAVRHIKSEIESVPVVDGADIFRADHVRAYASMETTTPRLWGAFRRYRTYLPYKIAAAKAQSQALVRLDGENVISSASLEFPADKLAQVPSRLMKKLEQLHLLNTAWEARELPDLFALFQRRNRLTTKAGLDWLMGRLPRFGPIYDYCRRYSPMDKQGFLARPVLDYFRNHQLAYSFGIMPTVGDIQAIATALKGGLKARTFRTTATIVQTTNAKKVHSLEGLGVPVYQASMSEDVNIRRVDGMRATLRRRRYYSDFLEHALPALVGLNPMAGIWQAMPFTWCVDMFLSIDDVLDLLWLQAQTEYEIECWSSTKILSSQWYTLDVYDDFVGSYPPSYECVIKGAPSMKRSLSAYERTPRVMPDLLTQVRARIGPKMGYLSALVALGFLPHRNSK